MKPSSLDLRHKILRAYDPHFGSQRAIAAFVSVSQSFGEKVLRRRRTGGAIAPRPAPVPGQCAHEVAPPQALRAAAQKKSLHAAACETPRVQHARAGYWQVIATREVQRWQCGDESGVHRAMTRLYGRAPTGERVVGSVPQH